MLVVYMLPIQHTWISLPLYVILSLVIQVQASEFFIMSSNALTSGHFCLEIFFFILKLFFVVKYMDKLYYL